MSDTTTRNNAPKMIKILPWIMCGLAAIFYCYEYLLRIAPSAMESELMSAFNITSAGVGLLSAIFYFAYTPMQLPVGVLMDKFGPRKVLTFATFCCAVGTALMGISLMDDFALLDPFELAKIGRFLIGFGSAFAFVGVLKLASVWLPPDRFAFIAGLTTTLGMVGAMVGQNMLTGMVDSLGLDLTLIYSCIVGFLLVPVFWLILRDEPKVNLYGTANESISFSKLWKDILQVFSSKQIWITGLIGILIMLPTTVIAELWGRLFLKTYYHFDGQLAATATSMIFLGWAVGGPLAGFLSDILKKRRTLLMVGGLLGAALMMILIYGPLLSTTGVFALLFLFGVVSSVEIIIFAVAKELSPGSVAGTAVAFTNFIVVCAGFFQWLVGKLLDMSRGDALDALGNPIYTVQDFQFAMWILPLSMFLCFFLCFFLKETHAVQVEH